MTLRLFNALFLLLVGTKMGVDAYGGCCCGGCGGCCCSHCCPCCNPFPCTNPPLLIKLPPTPPKLCCCCGCCCRPCCCCPCCCGGGRRRRDISNPLDKKCMKSMKKQVILCTNATRNCKRCANLPKLEIQKTPIVSPVNNSTPKDKKPKSRARRQVEMLGQMFGKSNGILPSQRFNFNQKMTLNGCKC